MICLLYSGSTGLQVPTGFLIASFNPLSWIVPAGHKPRRASAPCNDAFNLILHRSTCLKVGPNQLAFNNTIDQCQLAAVTR